MFEVNLIPRKFVQPDESKKFKLPSGARCRTRGFRLVFGCLGGFSPDLFWGKQGRGSRPSWLPRISPGLRKAPTIPLCGAGARGQCALRLATTPAARPGRGQPVALIREGPLSYPLSPARFRGTRCNPDSFSSEKCHWRFFEGGGKYGCFQCVHRRLGEGNRMSRWGEVGGGRRKRGTNCFPRSRFGNTMAAGVPNRIRISIHPVN